MRIEYIIIGFILMLIVLAVSIAMLSGVSPSFGSALGMLQKLIP